MRLALIGLLAAAASAPAVSPRGWDTAGRALYGAGDYALAVSNFAAAAESAPAAKLDPAVARYNEATAQLKQGDAAGAVRTYADALRTTDLKLQRDAYFNRGNALMAIAEQQQAGQKLEDATKAAGEALGMYQNAMALDPTDRDPKINYEIAALKKQQMEQQLRQQQEQQQKQKQDQQQKGGDQKKNEDEKQKPNPDEKKDGQNQKPDSAQQPQQQQQQDQKGQDEKQQRQQQASQGADEKSDEKGQGQPLRPEEMTKDEAALLLDAAKQQEQAGREQIRLMMGQPVPVEKDW